MINLLYKATIQLLIQNGESIISGPIDVIFQTIYNILGSQQIDSIRNELSELQRRMMKNEKIDKYVITKPTFIINIESI